MCVQIGRMFQDQHINMPCVEKVLAERKKRIKSLIDRIPTAKDLLFAFDLDWSMATPVCGARLLVYIVVRHAQIKNGSFLPW